MKATIFIPIFYEPLSGRTHCLTEEADSPESCLDQLQTKVSQILEYRISLTFRPEDGMILCGYDRIGQPTPIGVIYLQGFSSEKMINPHMYCDQCGKKWTTTMTAQRERECGLPSNCPACYSKQGGTSMFLHSFRYL
jgi:hypothetical protein